MPSQPVTIVTAASRGMGRAIAEELHRRGHRLVLLARGDDLAELADSLGASAVAGSVTDPHALEQAVQTAKAEYGRVDGVVNNTGHPPKGPLLEIPDADWHAGLDLVLLNVVRMARLVTPIMLKQGNGALVNISTFGAEEPSLAFPVSSSLRAGLGAFTKLYATEYGPRGLRMNNVLPGFIDSYPVDEETVADIPAGRPGSTSEVANAVAFLLSSEASYITGQNIRVDGGLSRSL